MLATVLSATVHGLDGRVVRVEVDVAPGLPGFSIVGLADTALLEARERVRGAIRNSGFVFPPRRITVNLAPADLRKAGASLDLGIALAILLGSEQVHAARGPLGDASASCRSAASCATCRVCCRCSRPSRGAGSARRSCRPTGWPRRGWCRGSTSHPAATLAEAVEVVRAPRTRPASRRLQPPRVELSAEERPREARRSRRESTRPRSPGPTALWPDLAEVRGQVEAQAGARDRARRRARAC